MLILGSLQSSEMNDYSNDNIFCALAFLKQVQNSIVRIKKVKIRDMVVIERLRYILVSSEIRIW